MQPKKAKMIVNILGIAMALVLVIGIHIESDFLKISAVPISLVLIFISLRYYRCPHCHRHLGNKNPKECPFCGKELE